MSRKEPPDIAAASANITRRIGELQDWRGDILAQVRELIHQAAPDIVEEWKWRGTPVWSQHGIVCTGETYKSVVKLTFARGAHVQDPRQLFNASMDGNSRRAIDLHEGDTIARPAFTQLIRDAIKANIAARSKKAK